MAYRRNCERHGFSTSDSRHLPAAGRIHVPLSLDSRGLRLHGARGVRDGQVHALDRSSRKEFRADARGIRMQRSGDHGDTHPRIQTRPSAYDLHDAVHELQRETPCVGAFQRSVLSGEPRHDDLRSLLVRNRSRYRHRTSHEAHALPGFTYALHHGAAAVSHAASEAHLPPHMGTVKDFHLARRQVHRSDGARARHPQHDRHRRFNRQ